MMNIKYYYAFFWFAVTLTILHFMRHLYNINWLILYYYNEAPSEGILFEYSQSPVPVILAALIGYMIWIIVEVERTLSSEMV
ncbi:hypothetical protein ACM26V_19645 [Salipaludibacillus sp. HK11]|uniref:hypothetical protein n=1 Tax=Salipaludibacillus sp. HK11 TaxID=3394320 RepID=UPI0039FD2838